MRPPSGLSRFTVGTPGEIWERLRAAGLLASDSAEDRRLLLEQVEGAIARYSPDESVSPYIRPTLEHTIEGHVYGFLNERGRRLVGLSESRAVTEGLIPPARPSGGA